MKRLPVTCPSCESQLEVSRLSCSNCETEISGSYFLPILLRLSPEEQEFIFQFIINSGSLKKMAVEMKNSYPTVRNKLDDVIQKIHRLKQENE